MRMYHTVFERQRIGHVSATKCPIEMQFGSNWSILNAQVIYIKKQKVNIFIFSSKK